VAITVDMQAQGEHSCVYPRRMAIDRIIIIQCFDIPTFPRNKCIKIDFIVDSLFRYSNIIFPNEVAEPHHLSQQSPLTLTYITHLVSGLTVTQYHEVNHLYQILWEDIPVYNLLGPSINQLILSAAAQCDGHTVEGNPFERLKGVYGLMDVTPNFPTETKEAFSFFIKNCPLNSTTSL
ncbi:MAG: hypothetical protein AB8F95_00335, partial [Bacteroidia bacterium]